MPQLGPTELVIVLVIVLLVLGPKRLPALGRQLGGGIREFRKSIGGGDDDDQVDHDQADRERADRERARRERRALEDRTEPSRSSAPADGQATSPRAASADPVVTRPDAADRPGPDRRTS